MPLSSLENRPAFYASASLVSAVNHAVQELFATEAAPLFHAALQLQMYAFTLRTAECCALLRDVATVLTATSDEQATYRMAFAHNYQNHREENQDRPMIESAAYAHQHAYNAFLS